MVGRLAGGWSDLWATGAAAGKFRLFDFDFDLTKNYTIWAGVIGGLVLSTATHGADQLMVQRYLSARSQRSGGGGADRQRRSWCWRSSPCSC